MLVCVLLGERKESLGLGGEKNKVLFWCSCLCLPCCVSLRGRFGGVRWVGVSFLSLYLSATSLLFPFLSFPRPPYNVPLCWLHQTHFSKPKVSVHTVTLVHTDRPQVFRAERFAENVLVTASSVYNTTRPFIHLSSAQLLQRLKAQAGPTCCMGVSCVEGQTGI